MKNNVPGIFRARCNEGIFLTHVSVHNNTLVDLMLFRDRRGNVKNRTYQSFDFVQQILVASRQRRFERIIVTYMLRKRVFPFTKRWSFDSLENQSSSDLAVVHEELEVIERVVCVVLCTSKLNRRIRGQERIIWLERKEGCLDDIQNDRPYLLLWAKAGSSRPWAGSATAGRVTLKAQRSPWDVGNTEHGRLRSKFTVGSIAINQSRHRIEAQDPAYREHDLGCATRTYGGKKEA
ncbi:hypothetical protein ARMSODRAFT_983841 [Armillaria solidipes]|uniref:Uncharacterized protein n=1 Tax=Armillaria solidipes TaxID=1076256 RepID=A0A2H3B1H6_9AGAR|nr:hypothetical protein ARMSODRAFT_983841 [Armillaria solidipes]